MSDYDFSLYDFTQEDWESCLKVLKALKDDPFNNPDNQLFSGLITKLSKAAKKAKKADVKDQQETEDISVLKSSVIAQNALNNRTLYSDLTPKSQQPYQKLSRPRNCYACKLPYQDVHFFYARMCSACAQRDYHHRFETTDLTGRIAILSGGRVKVGFATGLKLLRAGARLVVTTRFPAIALENYKDEKDYEDWKDNLCVYGLDLKNLDSVQGFIDFFQSRYEALDILINNAAQTIKYTDRYYGPLISKEQKLLPVSKAVSKAISKAISKAVSKPGSKAASKPPQLIANTTPVAQTDNVLGDTQDFGDFALTRFGQPVDDRDKTSWNSTLEEISLYELLEVNMVNQISPYMLIRALKPWFAKSSFEKTFIINVTSSEGQFSYSHKTEFHPHTNMTKAALNMMTRTSGASFAREHIYMYAVDVGWISTGAQEALRKEQFERGYIPPLDPVDGAARILHPIIEGMKDLTLPPGILLKNYQVTDW